jgi:hypothetical protein
MYRITRSRVGLIGSLVLAAGMAPFAFAALAQGALRSTGSHLPNWIIVPPVVCQALQLGPATTIYDTRFYCEGRLLHIRGRTITCKLLPNVTLPTPTPWEVAHANQRPSPCPWGLGVYDIPRPTPHPSVRATMHR